MIKGDRWKYSLVVALLFIFSLMLGCPAKGQISQPQVVFDEAGKAIQENNYPEAKQKLKSLLEANYEHGAVQLNLGYIYAVQDSLGNAIYYFRQAELHPEFKQEAKEGLRYARQRLPNREVVLPKLPWQQAFDWAGRTIGSNGLMTATLLFLYITVFFTLLYWFTQFMHHKGTLYLIYGSLLITLLLAIGSIHIAHLQQKYDIGVLVLNNPFILNQIAHPQLYHPPTKATHLPSIIPKVNRTKIGTTCASVTECLGGLKVMDCVSMKYKYCSETANHITKVFHITDFKQ